MTTTELVKALAKRMELSQRDAAELLRLTFRTISASLKEKETVIIRRFGSFGTRFNKPRIAFHPSARKKMKLPPKETVFFRASKRLKESVATRKEK